MDVPAKKNRALLGILAMAPHHEATRDRLAALLWSDRGEEQAKNSLRQALASLHKDFAALDAEPLAINGDHVALDPRHLTIDVAEFLSASASSDLAELRQAAKLYAGPLLDGLNTTDNAFEDWLREARADLSARVIKVFESLAGSLTGAERIAMAERLIALEPLREASHLALMQAHIAQGQSALAIKQYEACKLLLKRELGVEPGDELQQLRRSIDNTPSEQSAGIASSHKPTIAVLPFENKSGDPEQQYFSDGITEDLITELSRFSLLTVIGSHSSFAFRGRSLDITEIGRRLGVGYVVDGSIWRAGDKLRVAARLFDSRSGGQLWAERYDRNLEDIFAVRDDVVQAIVATVPGWIWYADFQSALRKRPENLVAYDYLLRGIAHHRTLDRAEARQAKEMFERAVAIDPGLAPGYAGLAASWLRSVPRDTTGRALDEALKLARKAVALDDRNEWCHLVLGETCLYHRQLDDAAFHFQRAMALNPNEAAGAVYMGVFAAYVGRLDEATLWMEKAFRLNPYAPPWYSMYNGMVLYLARRYADAVVALNQVFKPDPWEVMYLAASYAQLGRMPEAQAMLAEFQSLRPDTSVLRFATSEPFKNPAELEHLLDGLRKAGLPE